MADRPNLLALDHLRAELALLRADLVLHLRRLQKTGLLPPPENRFPGTAIQPPEIEARIERQIQPSLLFGILDIVAAAERAKCKTVVDAMAVTSPNVPLLRLRRAFELTDEEYAVLLLTLAPEFDPDFVRLYAYLQNHFEKQYATLGLLADCLRVPADSVLLRHVLDPEARLRALSLIRIDSARKEHLPFSHRPLMADPRIVRFVQGFVGLDEKLAGLARLDPLPAEGAATPLDPILSPRDEGLWRGFVRLVEEHVDHPGDLPVFYFRGPSGVGKHTWSRAAARILGLAHLRIDLPALIVEYGSLEQGLRVALREAYLQGAMLCLDGWARLVEPAQLSDVPSRRDQGPRLEASRILARVLNHHVGTFSMTTDDLTAEMPTFARPLKVLDLAMPDLDASMKLWKHYIPRERVKAQGLTVKRLAQSFRLTAGHIQEALSEVTTDVPPETPLTYEGLSVAIKRQTRHRLGENAKLVVTDYQWSDLVVPPDVDLQMRELVGRWQSKSLVFETWGLGRRFATGQGISVLFEGPPGTGKTMAASIVAKELDLDLYQIDLSKVVNRYIGETEKNLARIFDEAERSRVMLLFDEADSLFSSRTEVKSANDRYANLEVNYLLQRVEQFTGIAVLTTNFPTALDEAFRRRIAMRVTFPKPQVEERKRLWDSMLVNKQILAPELDIDDLAYEFELAGGHIKNAVLRAAFIAATRGCRIDQELLRIAARIELKEQGLLVHGSPYDELRAREN